MKTEDKELDPSKQQLQRSEKHDVSKFKKLRLKIFYGTQTGKAKVLFSFKSVFDHYNEKKLKHLKFIKDLLFVASEWSGISSTVYSKCSKISNTFRFLFTNKMLVIRAQIHRMLVRTANREDPDQTASSEVFIFLNNFHHKKLVRKENREDH